MLTVNKCDLLPSGCSQCKRVQIQCFGYRDANELLFRDQTQSVKSRIEQQRKALQADQRLRIKPAKLVLEDPATKPVLDLATFARQDFFTHYISGFSRSHETLGTLYRQTKAGSHLDVAVDAASLAFLAVRQTNCPTIHRHAMQRYVTALQLLNAALANPTLAPNDETLQAVLLLDFYEKLANRNPQTTTSWMKHMNGAVALIQTRGQRSLQTYTGRRLAERLYITLVISCGVAGVRVPRSLDRLKAHLDAFHNTDDAKWAVTGLNVGMINFSADVSEGCYATDVDIVAEASRLDYAFLLLEQSLPLSWRPTRLQAEGSGIDSPLVLDDVFDVYESLFVTQVINVIRISRVHLHLLIEQRADGQLATASRTFIENTAHAICASIPQFLVTDASRTPSSFSPMQTLNCYALLAPMYLAGRITENVRVRQWAVDVLSFISRVGNLEVAERLASLLHEEKSPTFWEIYAMLGSYAFAA